MNKFSWKKKACSETILLVFFLPQFFSQFNGQFDNANIYVIYIFFFLFILSHAADFISVF